MRTTRLSWMQCAQPVALVHTLVTLSLTRACAGTVLFLLLISGEALKWAQMTTAQLHGMGVLQLILTGCVGFAVAIWMIMNPRKVYKSITVRPAHSSDTHACCRQQMRRVGMSCEPACFCCHLCGSCVCVTGKNRGLVAPTISHVSLPCPDLGCTDAQNKVDSAKKMYESASSVALRASNAAVRASAAAGRASTRLSARTSAAAGRLSRTASGRARALSVRVSTALRRSSVRVADESAGFAEHSAVAMPDAGDAAPRPAEDTAPSSSDVFTARLQVCNADLQNLS